MHNEGIWVTTSVLICFNQQTVLTSTLLLGRPWINYPMAQHGYYFICGAFAYIESPIRSWINDVVQTINCLVPVFVWLSDEYVSRAAGKLVCHVQLHQSPQVVKLSSCFNINNLFNAGTGRGRKFIHFKYLRF